MERNYECMLILRPDIPEAEREKVANQIGEKIKELKGQVKKSVVWRNLRDFHYFLRSKGAERTKYYKGSYWLIEFILPTEELDDLKEVIRLEENILRSLILNKENDKVNIPESKM
ncbi:MAG: 30S ribosomal protein S6 [Candidatus Omnitrophica bacterium]|nr:30S ribosomal protein S6 [Candidatus Omnitrophota bacterium]MCF7891763.1 30S ribosomal protein S6 [Candidatus Omnitrophota bacterium]MCF7895519.1 30S ribosomal protein S6 [Candidatus Omnitrophota bacterium]MCF7897236.1 30S ribosomal protein S6 [Candidatus Omnitrophota bacterium]MCF7909424.1 30S ribosomal protein S6 [Candidatus Omnitrophota bacterium]